jgi:hypothetical protein
VPVRYVRRSTTMSADSPDDLPPIVRRFALACPRERAFALFTAHIGAWWPRGFTASGDRLAGVTVEGRVGGRVFEVDTGGGEHDWGAVTAWEAGRRFAMSWTLAASHATELELCFTGEGDTCDVRLEHRGWRAGQVERAKFDAAGGWDVVLAAYRTFAGDPGR